MIKEIIITTIIIIIIIIIQISVCDLFIYLIFLRRVGWGFEWLISMFLWISWKEILNVHFRMLMYIGSLLFVILNLLVLHLFINIGTWGKLHDYSLVKVWGKWHDCF